MSNGPAGTGGGNEYAAFSIIAERNIFNPNRSARYRGDRQPERRIQVDTISFVGTMSYRKGTFAFFDGTNPDHRKALSTEEQIAGFKVVEIEPNRVTLESEAGRLEMRVGSQLRREEGGPWELIARSDVPATTGEAVTEGGGSTGAPDVGSAELNDVLKRLMQRKEQESQ